jgi:hypothetical protein
MRTRHRREFEIRHRQILSMQSVRIIVTLLENGIPTEHRQFGEGSSMWSMTIVSTGPVVDSNFRPS